MTEERRKAAIEKVAMAIHANIYSPTMPESELEVRRSSKPDEWEGCFVDAEAALEAVGYFRLVEAAEAALVHTDNAVKVAQSCTVERQCGYADFVGIDGAPLAKRLRDALKEVTP